MRILCLDSGSSSLKFALHEMPSEQRLETGAVDFTSTVGASAQAKALEEIVSTLRSRGRSFDAVGHRVVFGGPDHTTPERIDDKLLAALDGLVAYDPLHLPPALAVIRHARAVAPGVAQVACFDTAFHSRMPALAKRYPLPAELGPEVRRYGYHGISYEYIVSTGFANGRAVIAHLGSGASLAAVNDGEPLETTMGFSPIGGLMMATRPGDLDPGVVLYLLRNAGFDADALGELLNSRCGLLGVSGSTADLRTLLERAPADASAREAIDLFVYIAIKHVGAMAAVLGGIDTLVFTGGIGEHAAPIRKAICAGCAYLGVKVDDAKNDAPLEDTRPKSIARQDSPVAVFVVPTNENLMIARHTFAALSAR